MTKTNSKSKKRKKKENNTNLERSNLIKAVVLSIFDEKGPTPKVIWPTTLEEKSGLLVAMKTISLLMGDSAYQDSHGSDVGVNYFGILPFPDLNLNGLTYFFLILGEEARGQALAATITVLIDEEDKVFFYKNMKYLRSIIDKAASQIQNIKEFDEQNRIIDNFREELVEFTKELKVPGDLGLVGELQARILNVEDPELVSYCKYCGGILTKGELIRQNCLIRLSKAWMSKLTIILRSFIE